MTKIFFIQENFKQVYKTLKEFFSLNIEDKNPLVILHGCLLYLKLEKEYCPLYTKQDAEGIRNSSLQMGLTETLNRTIRQIMNYKNELYFDKNYKYYWNKIQYKQIDNLVLK